MKCLTVCAGVFFWSAAIALAGNAVEPGILIVEPSTLHCLGFEWPIGGDDNRNAQVAVQYRAEGQSKWNEAQPLLRIGGESVAGIAGWKPYTVPHAFAGSIFNLDPGTNYEVTLTLTDAEGGNAEQFIKAKTKVLPVMFDGRKTPVKTAAELRAAFAAAQPGDQIVLAGGTYKGPFDFSGKSGQFGKPIVIRGDTSAGGKAIIEGTKTEWLISIVGSDNLWFEDLTFRDPGAGDGGHTKDGVVILAGNSSHGYVPGAAYLVMRNCTFEDFGVGIMAADIHCVGYVITDNHFLGRQEWTGPKEMKDENYSKHSYVAAWMNGGGHDVAYNDVRGFRDGINIESDGHGDEGDKRGPRAIDFYNNIITQMGDDFFEADGGVHNIRIMRNLCLNTQTCGLSAQPVYGGPAYFIGNILYNGPRNVALKFNVRPAGLIVYHNTFIIPPRNGAEWSNGHFRNNIFMTPATCNTLTAYTTFDFNGYLPGGPITIMRPSGNVGGDLAALQQAGYERHGRMLPAGLDLFTKVPSAEGLKHTYVPDELDFSLKAGSEAVDAGVVLANINDGYAGSAPDLGALEQSGKSVHFGPRPRESKQP